MKEKYYMHTIDRVPAFFDGDKICFYRKYGACYHNILVKSLRQIKSERAKSIEYRKKRKFVLDLGKYNHLIVYTT